MCGTITYRVEAGELPAIHECRLSAVDGALHGEHEGVAHRCREESDPDLQDRHSHVTGDSHVGAVGCCGKQGPPEEGAPQRRRYQRANLGTG